MPCIHREFESMGELPQTLQQGLVGITVGNPTQYFTIHRLAYFALIASQTTPTLIPGSTRSKNIHWDGNKSRPPPFLLYSSLKHRRPLLGLLAFKFIAGCGARIVLCRLFSIPQPHYYFCSDHNMKYQISFRIDSISRVM